MVSLHNRILTRVKQTEGGCLEWLGMVSDRGYGLIKIGGRQVKAHRVSYELYMGEIPEGQEVHHTCENKRCVNPRHLELVTKGEHLVIHMGGPPAVNRLKVYCAHGHEFTEGNTYRPPGGGRQCRECIRRRLAEWRARKHMVLAEPAAQKSSTGVEVEGF